MIGLTFPENQLTFIKKIAKSLEVPLYQIYTADQAFKLKRKKIILP